MYTLLSLCAATIAIIVDQLLKTKLLLQPKYVLFLGIVGIFKFFVNGYLTAHIVLYNSQQILGLRIGTIPVEDFIYGFALVTLCISLWEWQKNKL
jgi:lycopene cyclase domain-containing protein